MQPSMVIANPPLAPDLPRPGDYLCSERALYRVERVLGARALIEDCKTEALIDVSIAELRALKLVRRGADDSDND